MEEGGQEPRVEEDVILFRIVWDYFSLTTLNPFYEISAGALIWWRDNTEVREGKGREIVENYLRIIRTNSRLVNYFLLLHCLRMVLIVSEFPNTNSAGRFYFVLNYSSDWSDNSCISLVIYFTTKIKLRPGKIFRWHDHLQSRGNQNNHISMFNPVHFLYKIFYVFSWGF